MVPLRHWGRYASAAAVLLILAWLGSAFADANIQWSEARAYITEQTILRGLARTIYIAVLAQVVGVVLGTLFAVMRLSRNPVTSTVASAYIWFFRGTPVLVQLLFWYNLSLVFETLSIGIPGTGFTLYEQPMNDFMTPFMAAFLGLAINEGAYMAEIVRAGIISVDTGQSEAAHALGMTPMLTMRRVVLPQAMRVIVPPTGNEFISMLKTSSLASVITFQELLRSSDDITSRTLLRMETLVAASIWYLVLTSIASVGQYYLERRYARGAQRNLPDTPFQRVRANLLSLRRDNSGQGL